jgi:hypothetical protein
VRVWGPEVRHCTTDEGTPRDREKGDKHKRLGGGGGGRRGEHTVFTNRRFAKNNRGGGTDRVGPMKQKNLGEFTYGRLKHCTTTGPTRASARWGNPRGPPACSYLGGGRRGAIARNSTRGSVRWGTDTRTLLHRMHGVRSESGLAGGDGGRAEGTGQRTPTLGFKIA